MTHFTKLLSAGLAAATLAIAPGVASAIPHPWHALGIGRHHHRAVVVGPAYRYHRGGGPAVYVAPTHRVRVLPRHRVHRGHYYYVP